MSRLKAFASTHVSAAASQESMRFWVVTPAYEQGGGYWDPPEWGCDVVLVEAQNKRSAIRVGLRELRKIRSRWVQDKESDHQCPLNGLTAEEEFAGEEAP